LVDLLSISGGSGVDRFTRWQRFVAIRFLIHCLINLVHPRQQSCEGDMEETNGTAAIAKLQR
jgi:hypothetical protein